MRVLLADSHQLLHLGIRTVLSATNEIVLIDAVTSDKQLRQLCREQQPDIILLALNITASPHIDLLNFTKQYCRIAKIILLLHSPDEVFLPQLMESGIAGGILKSDGPAKLIEAIQAVAAGHKWFSPSLMSQLLQLWSGETDNKNLTERETDVLQLLAKGKTGKEIGQALGITQRTVRYHLQNIGDKLGTTTRIEAVAEAIRRKIIQ